MASPGQDVKHFCGSLLLPSVTPWHTSLTSVEVVAAGPFSLSPL